jgi:hypothetical protein
LLELARALCERGHEVTVVRAMERFAYRHAAVIAVPTPGLERTLLERGYPAARLLVVPHGVDPARFPLDSGARPVPGRVIYCGTSAWATPSAL